MDQLHALTETLFANLSGLSVPTRRKAILVVGMSRSGTSLTTRVLNALGIALPGELMGAGFGNPMGHWEPTELVLLNEHILDEIQRPVDDPRPVDPAWFRSKAAYDRLREIAHAIEHLYDGEPLIVIKDPRLCRLLPLYLEALDILDIEPLVLLQVRPPSEVCRSLSHRDRLDPSHSELLWLRFLTEAEFYSRSCARFWVSFDSMIQNWRDTVDRIADAFDLRWPLDPQRVACDMDRIIKPRLRHACDGAMEPISGHRLARDAWEATSFGLRGNDRAAQAGLDAVRSALTEMDQLYLPALQVTCDRHLAALEALRLSTCWRMTAPLRRAKLDTEKLLRRCMAVARELLR